MRSLSTTLAIAFCACALAVAPAAAKKKPQNEQQQQQEEPQAETPPRYTPFPHNLIFNLVDIDGKAPPREMWLRVDFDRARQRLVGLQELVGSFRGGSGSSGAASHADLHQVRPATRRKRPMSSSSGPFFSTVPFGT